MGQEFSIQFSASLFCLPHDIFFADYQPQRGVTESFFTEGEELTSLKNQMSDLQQSRDSLQEQIRTKDEKIEKLVSTVLRSQYDFSLLQNLYFL